MRNLSDTEKAQIAKVVGDDLLQHHGQKKFYSQREIEKANRRHDLPIDVHCWLYCLYMDHNSFDAYHKEIGEACDYSSMKSSMVAAITDHKSDSWFDFDWDLSWLELPDIEFGSFFDFFN